MLLQTLSNKEKKMSDRKVRIRTLMVPSVQEMVKNKLTTVPARYIQAEPPFSEGHVDSPSSGIPVIDMESLFRGDPLQLQNLHSACKNWGFFLGVNHGVSDSLMESMKRESRALFDLPMEEKKKIWQTPEQAQGFGQTFVMSEDQRFDWSDTFLIGTLPPSSRKPHLYPKVPLPFKDVMESYVAEVEKVAKKIVESLGEALVQAGYPVNRMPIYESEVQALKINYYPSCPEPHKVIGISPHSDANAITLLLQLNDTDGLQIKKGDGCWASVHPLPRSFIVNIGDMMEIISNGIYRSVEHRVVVNEKKERMCVATFHSPGLNYQLGPLSSLIGPKSPAQFQSTTPLQYLKGFFARKLEGKRYLDHLRIKDAGELANET